eukprot:gnl/Chilomastix_cuspidata/1818.p4 GENE.gnl/Chilomastix_cuspidata/1818~~gnl/Chilomastix_cuspidata/1818.p4  ORF type:complete len:125 (-),score=63.80 gnl/Chilomastix_cuspidata/1818:56-430(-)
MSRDIFGELMGTRAKLEASERQIQEARSEAVAKSRIKRRDEICLKEFEKAADDVALFRGVGKAYFLTPKAEVVADLTENAKSLGKDLRTLEGKIRYLDNQHASQRKRFEEIVGALNSAQRRAGK